jgi:hypothetical protein
VDPADLDRRHEATRSLASRTPVALAGTALDHISATGVSILVTSDGPERERRH